MLHKTCIRTKCCQNIRVIMLLLVLLWW